ncbi:MAG TPA: CoA transferase, partial [Nitrolancea sp.]|nr:CoA transferase [Nitrolancea sp.]
TEFGLVELGADVRLRTIAGRCDHREYVVKSVADALSAVPSAELIERLLRIGIPTARIMPVEETMQDPHVIAENLIVPLWDPKFGEIAVTPFPVHINGVSRGPGRPAPVLGADTVDVLREFGIE